MEYICPEAPEYNRLFFCCSQYHPVNRQGACLQAFTAEECVMRNIPTCKSPAKTLRAISMRKISDAVFYESNELIVFAFHIFSFVIQPRASKAPTSFATLRSIQFIFSCKSFLSCLSSSSSCVFFF